MITVKNKPIPNLEDLFETSESKFIKEKVGEIRELNICDLFEFKNHPFKVLEDEKMEETIQSIEENGVLVPIIVREREQGSYEIIAGHRRTKACELLGLTKIPAMIRDLSDDEATIIMVDTNLQREEILPSEKAFAYLMKLNAKKELGKITKLDKRSDELVAEEVGESRNQLHRYIRLTNLEKDLLEMVDQKVLAFNTAVELSYLTDHEQLLVEVIMEEQNVIPSLNQAIKLRKKSHDISFNELFVETILNPEEKELVVKTTINCDISRYFTNGTSKEEMEEIVVKLLDMWRNRRTYINVGNYKLDSFDLEYERVGG